MPPEHAASGFNLLNKGFSTEARHCDPQILSGRHARGDADGAHGAGRCHSHTDTDALIVSGLILVVSRVLDAQLADET
jgi:hypothetical protein